MWWRGWKCAQPIIAPGDPSRTWWTKEVALDQMIDLSCQSDIYQAVVQLVSGDKAMVNRRHRSLQLFLVFALLMIWSVKATPASASRWAGVGMSAASASSLPATHLRGHLGAQQHQASHGPGQRDGEAVLLDGLLVHRRVIMSYLLELHTTGSR